MVATMVMLERASMHPGRWVLPIKCNQRPPQFVVDQNGGKAPIRTHQIAQTPTLVTPSRIAEV
ncbi:hypothetical protein H7I87_12520 [Mycobacterium timonense]|uniref:Uncharacterized protein n=1 Tax=Mycobacterium bouchedurhonense TaxID=701041 RepID=A0AAW5S6P5_MYCBC|nr:MULTISPECIES: hypothetical protein [Mycobacterium avium complex (MAC)]MCV6990827.1 hypothetical protein [Mycobacterium bouchedurhonense]MCV6995529.1 hypothetical protein [Mycobacterium timonense]